MTIAKKIALLLALASTCGAAIAQTYPAHPLRMIVPFAAGGGTDIASRSLADGMAQPLGQPVIVENRPGANGIVGMDYVLQQPADGYMLLMFSSSTAVAHHFINRPFDLQKTFIPIGNVSRAPVVLAVNPKRLDVKTLPQLVAWLKANPGTPYGTVGPGSLSHLSMTAFSSQQGFSVTHIPYKGGAPAVQDAAGGQIPFVMADLTALKPFMDSGALRPVSVISSKRIAQYPDVPSSAEQGYGDFIAESVNGPVVAAGTPAAAVERLTVAVKEAAARPAFVGIISTPGNDPTFIDGPAFGRMITESYQRFGRVIRDNNIRME